MSDEFKDFESFRHGLVVSKIWLCEELEKVFSKLDYKNPTVHTLASWNNMLSFMMIVRKPNYYKEFFGYDIDENAIAIAKKICDTWMFESPNVTNSIKNINDNEYIIGDELVFINTSVDQIDGTIWYDKIPKGSLVCLQTTDLDIVEHPWYIKTITKTEDQFKEKFPMSNLLFLNTKNINYSSWGYNRLMMIGVK